MASATEVCHGQLLLPGIDDWESSSRLRARPWGQTCFFHNLRHLTKLKSAAQRHGSPGSPGIQFWDHRKSVPEAALNGRSQCPLPQGRLTPRLPRAARPLCHSGVGAGGPLWDSAGLVVLTEIVLAFRWPLFQPLLKVLTTLKEEGKGRRREKEGALMTTTHLRGRFVPVWGHTVLEAPGRQALCPQCQMPQQMANRTL